MNTLLHFFSYLYDHLSLYKNERFAAFCNMFTLLFKIECFVSLGHVLMSVHEWVPCCILSLTLMIICLCTWMSTLLHFVTDTLFHLAIHEQAARCALSLKLMFTFLYINKSFPAVSLFSACSPLCTWTSALQHFVAYGHVQLAVYELTSHSILCLSLMFTSLYVTVQLAAYCPLGSCWLHCFYQHAAHYALWCCSRCCIWLSSSQYIVL